MPMNNNVSYHVDWYVKFERSLEVQKEDLQSGIKVLNLWAKRIWMSIICMLECHICRTLTKIRVSLC